MNVRKITSMTMVWSFTILILNSLVLYVVPEGRVSYWADWKFLGLSKSQWGEQHTTVGFLFLAAGLLHVYYNWKPILAYMKNKARQVRIFTGPSNVGLALTIIFIIGTYFQFPPMSTIVNISDHFKNMASEKYGEPPYGHAETSSLKMFAQRDNLDLQTAIKLLTSAEITITDELQTIKEIASNNKRSPQQIYDIIKAAKVEFPSNSLKSSKSTFPDAPKPGWGKNKLSAICEENGLDLKKIVLKLATRGIKVEPEKTIKEIAKANNTEPMAVFEALHSSVTSEDE